MFGFGILSGLIFLPIVGTVFILMLRGDDPATLRNARWAALITSTVVFLLSLVAWSRYDSSTAAFQLSRAGPGSVAVSATSSASMGRRCPSSC